MGRMKGGANNEAELDRLSIGQIDRLIAFEEWRESSASNARQRKGAAKRLAWLREGRTRRIDSQIASV